MYYILSVKESPIRNKVGVVKESFGSPRIAVVGGKRRTAWNHS
jgi:hypothetical protein